MLNLRLIYSAIIVLIIVGGHYYLLYYAAVMITSIEFLNSQKAFKNLPNYLIFNAMSIGYLIFIALNRSRHFKFSENTEGVINIAEHAFFALIICLKLLLYFHLFSNYSFKIKTIFAIITFNLIGLFNEIFQNYLNHRALFLFIEDARKDMIINVLGTILFLLILTISQFFIRNSDPSVFLHFFDKN